MGKRRWFSPYVVLLQRLRNHIALKELRRVSHMEMFCFANRVASKFVAHLAVNGKNLQNPDAPT
jgi:hypothetical protein